MGSNFGAIARNSTVSPEHLPPSNVYLGVDSATLRRWNL